MITEIKYINYNNKRQLLYTTNIHVQNNSRSYSITFFKLYTIKHLQTKNNSILNKYKKYKNMEILYEVIFFIMCAVALFSLFVFCACE